MEAMAVAVNKTLYVRDEDAPVWDKARDLVGDKLSSFLTNHLKEFVASKEAVSAGFHRITLKFREKGKLPRHIAFHGRWLVPPGDQWDAEGGLQNDYYALALTAKNNIAIFNFYGEDLPDENDVFPWGFFEVFSSFEEAAKQASIPPTLLALGMERKGIVIEEWDI